jgi:hypothetical protein
MIRVTVEFKGRHDDRAIRNAPRQRLFQFNLTGAQTSIGQSQTKNVSGSQLELAHCAYELTAADMIKCRDFRTGCLPVRN